MGMKSTAVKIPSDAAEGGAKQSSGPNSAPRSGKSTARSPHLAFSVRQSAQAESSSLSPAFSQIPIASPAPAAATPPSTAQPSPNLPPLPLQRKLAVGEANDPLEREADLVADQVLRMPDSSVIPSSAGAATNTLQRKCSCGGTCESCKEESKKKLQRVPTHAVPEFHEAPPIVNDVLNSPGRALDTSARSYFEGRFGRDFSRVRIHTGPQAAESASAVNAKAFTVGQHIVFGDASSDLHSDSGKHLWAHELSHVVQQGYTAASSAAKSGDSARMGTQAESATADLKLSSPPPSAQLRRAVLNEVQEDFQPGAKACLVHLHGEEKTALGVAQQLRGRRCVNLMHLNTNSRPIQFDFTVEGVKFAGSADPNRIFTAAGRAGPEAIFETHALPNQPSAKKIAAAKIRAAAEKELQQFADGKLIPSLNACRGTASDLPVLALHNNQGLNPAKFKATASTSRAPNPATGDPGNPNDFFFVTESSDFDALKGTHNVVLQQDPAHLQQDDGSLSVFLGGARYINVEKEGREHQQLSRDRQGFQSHDDVYLRDYSLAAEALDLLGVPDMPCSASTDFDRRTKSAYNRRLGQSGRLPTKLATDLPALDREALPDPPPAGCLLFKDQPALDRRADEWKVLLDRIPFEDMIKWVLGGENATPQAAMAEFSAQQKCMTSAMTSSLASKGLSLPKGDLRKSGQRSFADQKGIWSRKFAFQGAPFDRISDSARAKCSPSLGTDVQWDPKNNAHRGCWSKLSDDEKQQEILMASSAPGVSRHHTGVDFDFGQTDADLEESAWTGSGRFSDAYRWLARNGSAFGFIQPFDTRGGHGTGYISERWHWSYYPIAEAALEFVMDHEDQVEGKLHELWGDAHGAIKPEFSFIAKNWKNYLFNVEDTGIF